jgi:hypothetical protein
MKIKNVLKVVSFTTVMFLSFIVSAWGINLVCDPQPASMVTKYRAQFNNGEILPAEIEIVENNMVRLHYNLDHLVNGEYNVIVAAGNDRGEWSNWSNTFSFCIGISTPQNININNDEEEPELTKISQVDWVIHYVSSEDNESENLANLVIDGNPNTFWHSDWANRNPVIEYPHEIQIDLGTEYSIQGFYYLSRQDGSWNGDIGSYVFYVSLNGDEWTETVSDAFVQTKEEQFITFDSCQAKYIKLVAVSEINENRYAAIAELNLFGR